MRPIVKGSVDQSTVIRIVDSVDGTPETGVVAATAGLDLQYRREGAAAVALTESDLAAVDSAHSDGGIKHIGAGYYRIDLPDAAVASGVNGVLVFGVVTGMVVIASYHPLVDLSPYSATVTVGTNNDKTGYALTSGEHTSIADALLKRDWTAVTGEAARSALNALRFLRNKWSITGTTLTVTEEDDTAAAWTATVTPDASADPITGSDPT